MRIIDGKYVGKKTVSGNLYLEGCTSLESLPDGLSVGGNLDLEGCTSLESLPDGLSVGGNIYLRGCTSLESLPDGLSVGGNLDLEGRTSLESLPDGLSVGGNLDLRGCTSLESLPEDITCRNIYFNGNLSGYEFYVSDGICGVLKSGKITSGIEILLMVEPRFEKGKLSGGESYYVVKSNGKSAHGKTLRMAMSDLRFKLSNRDKSKYVGISLTEQRKIEDLVVMYRTITGACSFGVESFIEEAERKDTYSINEIIDLTEGRYGNKELKMFFNVI